MLKQRLFYFCLFILMSYFVTAQELRCNISVSSQKIQGTNRELFTNMQRDMYEFLNNKRWSENIFQYDERIECSIQITLDEQIGSDQFRGSMQVRVSRPVYNSSYSTVLLNFRDNDIDYIYREFEPLEYSETGQNSNLVNLLAFYANIILGIDYDSFSLMGGNDFFNRAETIVAHVQNPVIGDGNGENLVIPRSSTKACIDFICDDLELAASYLPARWQNEGQDYGRITAGAALALKGRTLLLYASPLFNRADDASRWKDAYDANFAAITKLNEGNFGLAYEGNGGEDNAKNWARMFATYTGGSEAVFVTLYNNVSPIASQNINRYNLWEQGIRPGNINGGGGKTPTAEIIDIFPMIDGKKPMESGVHYDPKKFFLNRDPRFYRTFAFPGVEWKFNSGNVDFSGATMSGLCPTRYTSGANYELWNYCWYTTADERNNPSRSGFAADMLGTKNRGVYVRKRSDDFDLGTSLYVFTDNSSGDQQGFRRSAAPYMEIRYAEVLLNLAESACGAGGTYHAEGVKALKAVRGRVGYTSANNYGLDAAIETDRAKLFEAILYERQVELAFEGKRAYDMRRWMLFDGGVGQGALNASWALSGFGGNTCTYLGVTPMNERGKRYRIEINVEGTGSANNDSDPIKNVERPAALTLNEKIATEADGETILDPAVSSICTFYDTYFSRKDISLDGNVLDINPYFQPRYYFFGLRQSAQQTNATLYQTIGWEDYAHGGMGTFDPLAE